MKQENLKKSKVPNAGKNSIDSSTTISPSAASPGSTSGVPAMPNIDRKTTMTSQETLPQPPTLPPVFDPSSIYVNDSGGGAAAGSAPPLATFGDRYTKKRSKLPEVGGGFTDEDISGLDPDAQKKLEDDRRKRVNASQFVSGSGAAASSGGGSGSDVGGGATEEDSAFKLAVTSAEKTNVTVRKDLEDVILQGKIIDAVLETAINTDLPGKLRGIISRDVYSESSKRVVIPKGSRLIGSYATDVKFGQARVYVIWTRVIRPDGIDAVLDGSEDLVAVDALGRTGVYGDLDNRFFEIFGSSILLSSITVAFAVAADAAAGGSDGSTTTTSSGIGAGTTTTTTDVVTQGAQQAVRDLGSDIGGIAKQYLKTVPRITVDQGTRIKIFVNKDIIFPPSYFSDEYKSGLTGSDNLRFVN